MVVNGKSNEYLVLAAKTREHLYEERVSHLFEFVFVFVFDTCICIRIC